MSSTQDNVYWSCTRSRWTSRVPLAVTRALGCILYTGQYLIGHVPIRGGPHGFLPCCHQGSRLHPLHRTISIGHVPIRDGPHVFLPCCHQGSRLCPLHRTMSIGHVPVRGGPPVFPLLSPGLSAVSSTHNNIYWSCTHSRWTSRVPSVCHQGSRLYPLHRTISIGHVPIRDGPHVFLPCCHQGSRLYPLHRTISIVPVSVRGGPPVFLPCCHQGSWLYPLHRKISIGPVPIRGGPPVFPCSFLAVTGALGRILYAGQYLLVLYPFEVDLPCSFLAVTRALGCVLYTGQYLLVLYPFEVDLTFSPCCHQGSRPYPLHRTISIGPVPIRGGPHVFPLLSPGLSAASSTQDNIYWSCTHSRWTSCVPSVCHQGSWLHPLHRTISIGHVTIRGGPPVFPLLSPGLSAAFSTQDNIYWSCTHSRWASRVPSLLSPGLSAASSTSCSPASRRSTPTASSSSSASSSRIQCRGRRTSRRRSRTSCRVSSRRIRVIASPGPTCSTIPSSRTTSKVQPSATSQGNCDSILFNDSLSSILIYNYCNILFSDF